MDTVFDLYKLVVSVALCVFPGIRVIEFLTLKTIAHKNIYLRLQLAKQESRRGVFSD